MRKLSWKDPNDLGNFLKERRSQARLTQQELSKRIGVTWQTVHNWERKHSFPSKNKLQALSKVLQLPFTQLFKIQDRLARERQQRRIAA